MPESPIYIQGSSLRVADATKIGDIDVAIKVDAAPFSQLEKRFKSLVESDKVFNRIGNNGKIGGLDMFKSSTKGEPSLTVEFYQKFEKEIGQGFTKKMGVEKIQISIIKEGSQIDVMPYLKLK